MGGSVLVTGPHGFVGRHLCAALGHVAVPAEVDVVDGDALRETVRAAAPAGVVHLAARSSVAESWRAAAEVWHVNALGTVNLLDAVRDAASDARVLVVSTGEVYGRAEVTPTDEGAPLAPLSPYAASKAAAEIAAFHARRAENVDVAVARPFTHAGPGQDHRFAIGSWTHQIARAELAGGGTLRVGDLEIERDLIDVRDVCRAYMHLLEAGSVDGVYNVASGRAVSLSDVVDVLVTSARCEIVVERDASLFRATEIPLLRGDASRLTAATGWTPEIPLEQTLADALEEARRTVRQEPALSV